MKKIYEIPTKLMKAHYNEVTRVTDFLIEDGFKSFKYDHWEDCWTMSDEDYTWFLLKWC